MGEPGQAREGLLRKLAASAPGEGVCGQDHPGANGVHSGDMAWGCEVHWGSYLMKRQPLVGTLEEVLRKGDAPGDEYQMIHFDNMRE